MFVLALIKKDIKKWYASLNNLYEFEKVSVLYGILKNGIVKTAKEFENLELVEELLEILKAKIEIAYDDIALIIYRGSREELPELFKNINTGSVALSQYEILQSVWNGYLLESRFIGETRDAFGRELEQYYAEADICSCYFDTERHAYMKMATPIKLLEYISYVTPVLATKGSHAAEFIEQYGAGWSAVYTEAGFTEWIEHVYEHQETIVQKHIKAVECLEQNTWIARALQVAKDLERE